MIYNRVYILLLLFSLYKNRFVAYDLGYKVKKVEKKIKRSITIKKKGYSYQKMGIWLLKEEIQLLKREIYIKIPYNIIIF